MTNSAVWVLVIFIEGFASLGIEVVALRRLVPHVGSSITVTAPTIGLFLAALAIGYWSGGQVRSGFERRMLRNFLLAALIAGVGLSSIVVQRIFGVVGDPVAAWLLFMVLVVCPPAWLLAQTVPLLTNVAPHKGVGAASGAALSASTAGSVLGASVLALVVMQQWGVSVAVLLCAASLLLVAPIAIRKGQRLAYGTLTGVLLAVVATINLLPGINAEETAYADYRTREEIALNSSADGAPSRVFIVNNQRASRLDSGSPPKASAYIERMRNMLLGELRLRDKQVLVLGAGGFTLSGDDQSNHYTYVDIDPKIRAIAEKDFLRSPINGTFVVEDARGFVAATERQFDAIVVDVYSAHASVPAHLVTLEFWRQLHRPLTPGGVVLVNLILDSTLQSDYARNLLATVERGLGRCAVEVLHRLQPIGNVLLICQPAADRPPAVKLYTDERNRVDLDRGVLGY